MKPSLDTRDSNVSAFARAFRSSSSAVAVAMAAVGLPLQKERVVPTHGQKFVRHTKGKLKPRTPFKHIIRYETRQVHVGDAVQHTPVGIITKPIFVTRHMFLHATKGWRNCGHVPYAMGAR